MLPSQQLATLTQCIIRCRRCPRLVEHRERIAAEKKRAYCNWDYWGKPVPGFGDPAARLMIVGLAPAAHGANRTGRMFTGDTSGDWLYGALHRFRFASQAESFSREDGLRLNDCFISAAGRCAPPGNKPTQEELDRCLSFLERELALLERVRVVLALGHVAHRQYLRAAGWWQALAPRERPAFGHHAVVDLPNGVQLLSSYHPSRQNTNTRKLTRAMWYEVFQTVREILDSVGEGRRGATNVAPR